MPTTSPTCQWKTRHPPPPRHPGTAPLRLPPSPPNHHRHRTMAFHARTNGLSSPVPRVSDKKAQAATVQGSARGASLPAPPQSVRHASALNTHPGNARHLVLPPPPEHRIRSGPASANRKEAPTLQNRWPTPLPRRAAVQRPVPFFYSHVYSHFLRVSEENQLRSARQQA